MVAKNQCLMRLRGKGIKALKELTEYLVAEEDSNKETQYENELTFQFLEEALYELSEEQRVCVTLFYLQKESYSQISERTGYSLLQVKSYIQNGKRNLKLLLQKKLKANKA
jgi:RNA polymerase sigma-70 factor (ECF subfamily)